MGLLVSSHYMENSENKRQEYLEKRYRSGKSRKQWRIIRLYKASKFARSSNKMIRKGLKGVGQEAEETKDMASSFFKLLQSKLNLNNRTEPPTEEEVKAAIEQLKDVGRFSIFSAISIIPGGGFSLIGLEMLARKLGVKNFTFVPSAFRKEEKKGNQS